MPLTGETIATATITALSLRIEPGQRETLRTGAYRKHRSVSNIVEVMTRDYRGLIGFRIPE